MGSNDLDSLQKQLEALKKKNVERKSKSMFKFFKKRNEGSPDSEKPFFDEEKEERPARGRPEPELPEPVEEKPAKPAKTARHELKREHKEKKPDKKDPEVIPDNEVLAHLDPKEKELLDNIDKLLEENG